MPEENIIKFSCPVCKSGWAAKASLAGKKKVCPKCQTEILVPLPSDATNAPSQGTLPVAVPHSKASLQQPSAVGALCPETAIPARKKRPSLQLLLGIPAVLILGTIIVILTVYSNRGTTQPKTDVAQLEAKPNPVPVPPEKEVPKPDERKWMDIVEKYLRQNVKKYTITKTYPTESLIGAYCRVGGKDAGIWLPLDQSPHLPGELSAAQLPTAQAKELEKLRGKPLEKMSLDDLLKIESEELKKLQPEELTKIRAEKPKSLSPEEQKNIEVEEQQKKEEMERQAERIRAGRAPRLEYDADEGFGRVKHYDVVFVIDTDSKIVQLLATDDFRIGKPPEK
jgi:hypothetical protein